MWKTRTILFRCSVSMLVVILGLVMVPAPRTTAAEVCFAWIRTIYSRPDYAGARLAD